MQRLLQKVTRKVLFDEYLATYFFPEVPVTLIGASRSNWHCLWAGLETKRRYNYRIARGQNIRPMRFVTIEEANHFVRPALKYSDDS